VPADPAAADVSAIGPLPHSGVNPPGAFSALWADFRENRGAVAGLALLALIVFLAIFADVVAPYGPAQRFEQFVRIPPAAFERGSWAFPLGTDEIGRDMLSRLIYGARLSLFIGIAVVALSLVTGVVLGLISAFAGGLVDIAIMRAMDVLLSIPSLLLAILVVAVLGPSLGNTIVAITIVYLPNYVRLTRAAAMTEMSKEYVTAARVAGCGRLRIMFRTVLPNCLAPLIVQATLGVSNAILEAAALGFLGMGAQPPSPEWGAMLASAREFLESAPWIVTLPGVAILLTVLAINLVGDGLRDALDPKLRRG
jgi:dipeptide transport system permease protein